MVAFVDKLTTEDGKPLRMAALDEVHRLGYNIDDEAIAKDKRGGTLTERERIAVEYAKSEAYAKATELLLGSFDNLDNEKISGRIINRLVNEDRSLARKVLTKIKDAAKIIEETFKGNDEAVQTLKLMREAEKHFADALAASGTGYYHGKENARKAAQKQESKRFNEFNTLAMQWAFSDKTEIGEQTVRFRGDKAVLIEKTDNGYVEVLTKSGDNYRNLWSKAYEQNERIRNNSVYESATSYETERRNGNNDNGIDGRRDGQGGRDGRVYQEQSERNGNAIAQESTGNQSEIKESRRGYAGRNPADVTEQEYNHHYWAVANDVLSTKESGALRSAVGEINQGAYYPQTADGKYMVAVGENGVLNKIVFTDGGQESYSVEKVIEIDLDNETELANTRWLIYERERNGLRTENQDIFKVHAGTDYSFYEFKRTTQQAFRDSRSEQDGRRSGAEAENRTGNEVKHSLRENATDSEGRTLSPKQIEYFKDTKVVDKNGNLLVVYHGTRNDFTVFDKSKGGESNNIADIGFWFTESKQGAQDWADNSWWGDSKTGKAMPLYLEINNPKIYESTDNNTDALIKEKTDIHRQRAKIAGKYLYDVDRVNGIKGIAEWDAFFSLAEKNGSADYYLDKISAEKKENVLADYEQYKDLEAKEERLGEKISDLHYTSDGYQKFRTDIYKVAGQSAEDANIGGNGKALKNSAETKAKFVEMLKEQGYDGIIIHTNFDSGVFGENNTQYITFDSNQAKNIDNLNPTADSDIRYSRRSFDEQVDAVLNGADTVSTHLKVRDDTPKLLVDIGLDNKPILMTAKHTKSAVGVEGVKGNVHHLSKETLKKLPELLENPAIVMESTKEGSIVMFVNAVDEDNNPVLCAVKVDGDGYYNDVIIDANVVTSIYGKDTNPVGFISKAVDDGRLLYWDKKMSQTLLSIPGLQLPDNITKFDSNTIIRKITRKSTGDDKIKHSLRDVDGEKVVVVDTDQSLFDGLQKSEYAEVAREYMKEKYRGQTIDGIKFTRRSENEYTRSESATNLQRNNPIAYEGKMRAVTELVNFIKAGEFISHEDAKHPKPFNTGGYNRYAVKFVLDGVSFDGELLVALNENGQGMFYDIVKIKENGAGYNPIVVGASTASSTNSILQNSEKSTGDDKIKHSRRKKSDADRLLDEARGPLDKYFVEDGYRAYMVEVPDAESLFADDPEGLKLANQVIRMANDSSESNRTAFAEEIAMHIIDNAIITNRDLDSEGFDRERANIIRRYMHSVDLSGIMDELVYTYDKKGANNIRLVWGATKNGPSIHIDDAIMELRGYGG